MNDAKVVGNNALVLGTAEPPQVERPEEENKLGRQVSLIERQASSVAVTSEEGFVRAGELTKQVKAMQKQVTEYWEPMRKSTYEAYTAVNQHKKEMLDPLESAENILKRKMSDYTMEQERIRREQEEAMRKAAEAEMARKLEEAEDAESRGDTVGAEFAMAEAEVMEGVAVSGGLRHQAPKAKGVSQTKTWKITKIDSEKVPVSLNGMELRPVDEKLVLQLIKASKGKISIPGVEYKEDVIISVRS